MKTSLVPASLIAAALGWPTAIFHAADAETVTLDPAAVENLKLTFAESDQRVVSTGIRAPGTVRLDEKRVVDVVPRIPGIIAEDFKPIGAAVTPEDKLFKLESAELSRAITAYVDAEQAMIFAHTALDQEKKLAEKDLSSKEQLQQKELAFQQAVAEHARALQPLKLLHFNEATVHQYLNNVGAGNYTTLEVKAPAAGEIIEKSVRIGAAIEPDETLYTIADLSQLWVDFQVSLRDAEALAKEMTVLIRSSITDQQREATIIYIAPLADEASRTVLVRAAMNNDDHGWRPGTPIVVTAAGGKGAEVVAVPASAIVDFNGGRAVFVRRGESTFAPTPVETGASDGDFTEITSGLDAGQTVISGNAAQLKGHLEMTAEE